MNCFLSSHCLCALGKIHLLKVVNSILYLSLLCFLSFYLLCYLPCFCLLLFNSPLKLLILLDQLFYFISFDMLGKGPQWCRAFFAVICFCLLILPACCLLLEALVNWCQHGVGDGCSLQWRRLAIADVPLFPLNVAVHLHNGLVLFSLKYIICNCLLILRAGGENQGLFSGHWLVACYRFIVLLETGYYGLFWLFNRIHEFGIARIFSRGAPRKHLWRIWLLWLDVEVFIYDAVVFHCK